MRVMLDGVLYVLQTGGAWRHLPRDFPPCQTTLRRFLRWPRSGVAGRCGWDAAKHLVGRKRPALVDTEGRLLLATVSPADLHDSRGEIALLQTSRRAWPFIALC